MALTDATKIWFERMEAPVVGALKHGTMPFLGLYTDVFKEGARAFLRKLLAAQRNPADAYREGLARWPAVFSSYLSVHVVEGYGQDATQQVYEYVERAVSGGTHQLGPGEKEKLWKAYRSACIRLGLSVSSRESGTNFMVNEYLRQAGVPLAYVADLTQRMATLTCGDSTSPSRGHSAKRCASRHRKSSASTPTSCEPRTAAEAG